MLFWDVSFPSLTKGGIFSSNLVTLGWLYDCVNQQNMTEVPK